MSKSRVYWYIFCSIIGLILIGLGFAGIVDEFWNGMGFGLFIVGVLRLLQQYRLNKNDKYREKMETEINDERNNFIRNKAWAWAGYLFVLSLAIIVIVLKVLGQDLLASTLSYTMCFFLVLFWICYFILKKKY